MGGGPREASEPAPACLLGLFLTGSEEIRDDIRPSARADLGVLLDVYRNAYSARLVEVLANDFPGLKALVGEAEFEWLARAYIAVHPSRGFSVRTVGERLTEFLAGTDPWARRPALADMAAFEWALAGAFDAGDAEPVRIEDLAAIPPAAWAGLIFAFHPSVRRLRLATRSAADPSGTGATGPSSSRSSRDPAAPPTRRTHSAFRGTDDRCPAPRTCHACCRPAIRRR